ncbi:MAG: hypothetical protein Q4G09_00360 [Clostridia bacterium]|nr:hypothetical protein [Clostridia bacterium]
MENKLNEKIIDKVKTKIAISNFEEKEIDIMPKNKIFKMVASFVLVIGLTCGIVYAGIQMTSLFRIKGMDDTGIQTALENQYVQNIDMDYIEKEKVKFKVDYLMMDDINFDLVFNFVTNDSVGNYERIALQGLEITDENNNQIYISSDDQNIWTKNIALSGERWSVVEKQDHTLRQVVHFSSNNFPKSNKIYVSFDKVILYNVNQGNPITIEYEDTYRLEFDVSEQLSQRNSITYIPKSETSKIEEAKLTNSGFAVTINTSDFTVPNENLTVQDKEGNIYTLTNSERIFDIENLNIKDFIEPIKTVLIFNITKYNESDSITLHQKDRDSIEFIKK